MLLEGPVYPAGNICPGRPHLGGPRATEAGRGKDDSGEIGRRSRGPVPERVAGPALGKPSKVQVYAERPRTDLAGGTGWNPARVGRGRWLPGAEGRGVVQRH